MAAITISGPKENPFPRKTRVLLVSLPDKSTIYDGQVTKSVTLDLDPGKYMYTAIKHDKSTGGYLKYGELLHECDENQWKVLAGLEPKMAGLIQTTGGPKWRCRYFQCGEERTSRFSAVVHEAEHFGMTLEQIVANAGDREKVSELAEAQSKKQRILEKDQPGPTNVRPAMRA